MLEHTVVYSVIETATVSYISSNLFVHAAIVTHFL